MTLIVECEVLQRKYSTTSVSVCRWIEEELNQISSLIKMEIRKVCPLAPKGGKMRKQPGWTADVQTMKARARTLLKRFKRESWKDYVLARRDFKKSLGMAKKSA